jgi:hypothetical protein
MKVLKRVRLYLLLSSSFVLFFTVVFMVFSNDQCLSDELIEVDEPGFHEHSGSATQKTITTECYYGTQAIHSTLEVYTNELIALFNTYLFRDNKMTIDEMIAQMLPVLKGALAQTKSDVWTINRLAYLETFHEAWEQDNPKAYQVITDHIDRTIARIEEDLEDLEKFPLKAPSMTEIPLLMDHYQRTREMLTQTHAQLSALYMTMTDRNQPTDSFSDETKSVSTM